MTGLSRFTEPLRKLFSRTRPRQIAFPEVFSRFQNILKQNNALMEIIADMDGKAGGDYVFDKKYLIDCIKDIEDRTRRIAYDLNFITGNRYLELYDAIERLIKELESELSGKVVVHEAKRLYHLDEIEEGMEDIVGNKAYNLSRLRQLPKADIPSGFVVTIAGFRDYLAYNNLFEKIETLIEEFKSGDRSTESTAHAANLMILGGEIPPYLRQEILSASRQIRASKSGEMLYSVRSSAVGEDGDWSFAGLHDSFLNVPYDELLSCFKKVLASLYSQSDLQYRLTKNLFDMEMAIPVLYQVMIASRVSGVLYTLDPNEPEKPECLISGNWGLGRFVVESQGPVDTFRVLRSPPHSIIDRGVQRKQQMMPALSAGPLQEVPDGLRETPCLTSEEVRQIVEVGLILERFFKKPLDVEWCLDDQGQLWILQARHLRIPRKRRSYPSGLHEILEKQHVLLANRGMIAYRSIGAGPVKIVRYPDDLIQFPAGAVLVSQYAHPWLAKAIPGASAVITDIGTTTGHMATVAREFRIPTIVGAEIASQVLPENQEVTVDAQRNIVYKGRVLELLRHQLLEKQTFEMRPEFQLLHRLLKRIAPLFLTDPDAPDFSAKGCKTIHDIIRFVHQKAFQTLVQSGRNPRICLQGGEVPLDLVLIDIGGGLADSHADSACVYPEQITSFPMKILWQGLSSPNAWSKDPVPVDFKGLMSSMTRTRTTEVMGNSTPAENLAVIGAEYVNLNLPLGYHFTAVEASVGPARRNNHIFFRFVGGVTDLTRRSRRAAMLMSILEQTGFKVEVNGDLVIARATELTKDQMEAYLFIIGRLIGFARQLDVLLKDDRDIGFYVERFMSQLKETNENPNADSGG